MSCCMIRKRTTLFKNTKNHEKEKCRVTEGAWPNLMDHELEVLERMVLSKERLICEVDLSLFSSTLK